MSEELSVLEKLFQSWVFCIRRTDETFHSFFFVLLPFRLQHFEKSFHQRKKTGTKKGSINDESFSENLEHLNESKAKWKFGGDLASLTL